MLTESILQHTAVVPPFAEDTAASIIRREGFPPTSTQHTHVPHAYDCPCCAGISPRKKRLQQQEQETLMEYRKRMQWDVIDDRAKPSAPPPPGGKHIANRHTQRRFYATLQRPLAYNTRAMSNPPPPRTLQELRRMDPNSSCAPLFPAAQRTESQTPSSIAGPHLLFTAHQGSGFTSGSDYQLQIRYGSVEGMTRAAPVDGAGCGLVQWDEAFQLPLQDFDTPVELFVIDANTTKLDYVVGGVMLAPPVRGSDDTKAWSRFRGDHVDLCVTSFDRLHGSEAEKEQERLSICVSWEVMQLPADATASPHRPSTVPQSADVSLDAVGSRAEEGVSAESVRVTFDVLRVVVYSSAAQSLLSHPPDVMYCMARTDSGECSDYVALGLSQDEVSTATLLTYDHTQDTGRCFAIESTRMPASGSSAHHTVHLLVCSSDEDNQLVEEGSSLRVVGCTTLTYAPLASHGTATYVLDTPRTDEFCSERDGTAAPYGEVVVQWTVSVESSGGASDSAGNAAHRQPDFYDDTCAILATHDSSANTHQAPLDHDILSVVVVRGIDLRKPSASRSWGTEKLVAPQVTIAVESLAATTPPVHPKTSAPRPSQAPCNVVWNQELLFHLPNYSIFHGVVEVSLEERGEVVSVGEFGIRDRIAALQQCLDSEGSAEGFEVVPLTQAGFTGSLGHVLVRWKYVRHNLTFARAEKWKSQGVQASPQRVHQEDDEEENKSECSPSSPSLMPRPHTRSADAPLRRLSVESPRREEEPVEPSSTAWQHPDSPGASVMGVLVPAAEMSSAADTASATGHTAPPRNTQQSPSTATSRRAASITDADANEEAFEEIGKIEEDSDVASAATPTPWVTNETPVEDDAASAPLVIPSSSPRDAAAVASRQRTKQYDALPSVVGSMPEMPKLRFCIRPAPDGKPRVAFFESTDTAATAPQPAEMKATDHDSNTTEPVVPPVNGPGVRTSSEVHEAHEWSSEIVAASAVGDVSVSILRDQEDEARRLIREELEVQYKAGRRGDSSLIRRPFQPQPWYPPGESKDETHVPVSRRESERKQLDAIVELKLKSRFVHQSVARQQRHLNDVSRSTSLSAAPPRPSQLFPPPH